MAWVTGYEGGPPIIPGGPVDPMVGAHAALAVVAALEHRAHTGAGHVSSKSRSSKSRPSVTAEQVIRYAIDGTLARPARRRRCVPRARATTRGWRSTGHVIRWRPRSERSGVPARTPDASREGSARAGRPGRRDGSRVRDASTTRRCEPGVSSKPSTHPLVGEQHYPTWPVRMSAGPAQYWSGPAPTLGQHTDEVLRDELGVDDAELARLEAEHVIGTVPDGPLSPLGTLRMACCGRGGARILELESVEDALVDGDVAVSSGVPRRPRCATATSASSTAARSRRTSARGCRTSSSAPTRATSRTTVRTSACSSSRSSGRCCSSR